MHEVAPQAATHPAAELAGAELNIAGTGRRFANFLLDTLFFYAFAFAIGVVIALLGLDSIFETVNDFIFGIILVFLYYVPQEATNGRTLAKWITKTKVVSANGDPISLGQAAGRTACRFIPFEPFSFLSDGPKPHGWHDSIPKTYVVSLAKA